MFLIHTRSVFDPPVISPQPFAFLPVVVLSNRSVPPPPVFQDHSSTQRRATRKSLKRINLLYLLLCYAIIKTEHGAGQKEIMVFAQHGRWLESLRLICMAPASLTSELFPNESTGGPELRFCFKSEPVIFNRDSPGRH